MWVTQSMGCHGLYGNTWPKFASCIPPPDSFTPGAGQSAAGSQPAAFFLGSGTPRPPTKLSLVGRFYQWPMGGMVWYQPTLSSLFGRHREALAAKSSEKPTFLTDPHLGSRRNMHIWAVGQGAGSYQSSMDPLSFSEPLTREVLHFSAFGI